jgi:ubiquinone/menaquinone biosynthesis C-methylase UbiE
MKPPKANYQKIARTYDMGRFSHDHNLELWSQLVQSSANLQTSDRILDLGCGTGRYAIGFARKIGCKIIGADASPAMLDKAREKEGAELVDWEVQNAGSLTYPDNTFEAVFMSHLLHHVESPVDVITECKRVIKPLGAILIKYGAMEQVEEDVEHVFFPETIDIDRERTLSVAQTEGLLLAAGYHDVVSQEVMQQTYVSAQEHLQAAAVKSTSVLHLISDEAFAEGLERLAEYVNENPDEPWLQYDKMTLTTGYKPV